MRTLIIASTKVRKSLNTDSVVNAPYMVFLPLAAQHTAPAWWSDVARSVRRGSRLGVEESALSLGPGEGPALAVGGAYYYASESRVSWPLAVGMPVYAQADSFNAATSYGAVLGTRGRRMDL